jgi:hypothetical protein
MPPKHAIILCLLLVACSPAQSPTIAIRGVTVVDVRDGSLHPDCTLDDIRDTQEIVAVVADGRLSRRADLDQLLARRRTHEENRMRRE